MLIILNLYHEFDFFYKSKFANNLTISKYFNIDYKYSTLIDVYPVIRRHGLPKYNTVVVLKMYLICRLDGFCSQHVI